MAGPPDDPTRRLQPAAPHDPYREPVYAEDDPLAPPGTTLLDRLRSLQRWLAVVGAIALAGLGIALYTLLAEDEEGNDGRGASRQSVRDLRERVEAVEEDVDDRATKTSVSELRGRQEELDARVDQVAEQAGEGGGGAEAQQAAEELQSDLQALEQRVESVEQQAAEGGGDTGDGSP